MYAFLAEFVIFFFQVNKDQDHDMKALFQIIT